VAYCALPEKWEVVTIEVAIVFIWYAPLEEVVITTQHKSCIAIAKGLAHRPQPQKIITNFGR